jgi:ferredoxin-NADP reductase
MATHEVNFRRHAYVAEGTMAFYFEKPAGFQFKAGQSVDLTILEPEETDAEGNTRAFSLISAPYEDELAVATRMRDTAFKRVLKKLPPDSKVRIAGPFGSFTLHNNAARAGVFLAGGIGITPFLSMIKQACHDRLPHRLFLFYSNKRPEDAAFLVELEALQHVNPNFRLIATMTELEHARQSWEGATGHIDPSMVKHTLKDLVGPVYYAAGPPGMVASVRKMLNDAGIDDDDIRTEEFAGYQ